MIKAFLRNLGKDIFQVMVFLAGLWAVLSLFGVDIVPKGVTTEMIMWGGIGALVGLMIPAALKARKEG